MAGVPAGVAAPGPAAGAAAVVAGLTCAACGGTLAVHEGWTHLVCRYCATPLVVLGSLGAARLAVPGRLDREAALGAVRRWFAAGLRKEPALKAEAVVEEAFLAWFPFVRVRCDVVGCVLGTRTRRVKQGNRWVERQEPVERLVEESFDRTRACADTAEFGVDSVNLAGDALEPLDEGRLRGRGMVFRPVRAVDEVASALLDEALASSAAAAGVERVSFSWLAPVRRAVTLVYYPLWVVRYRFRGRLYQALVDGEDGSLAYGKAPGNLLFRAWALVSAAAGACFAVTTGLQNLGVFLRSDEGLGGGAVLLLAAAGLVAWGYRQFRHGGVVEEGTGLAASRRHGSLAATIAALTGRVR